jgi:nitroreductase
MRGSIIKRFLPFNCYEFLKKLYIKIYRSNFLERIRMVSNSLSDLIRYSKYSATFKPSKSKISYESYIIFLYHKIEKGLSLRYVKVGFGKENINKLIIVLEDYYRIHGWGDICQAALSSLEAYYKFNNQKALSDIELLNKINKLKKYSLTYHSEEEVDCSGGIVEIFKKDINKSKLDFKEFAYSRYSIRNFISEEVDINIIREAISVAQKTPSVCNRQTSRVHIYSDTTIKNTVLKHQNGNAGFGENASKILIITNRLECFIGAHEKNQCYIDGGMYAMSLIYALHSLGVGTCALNLALNTVENIRLREAANISDSEVMIMMIAVGNIPDKFNVATSYRRDANRVMKIH